MPLPIKITNMDESITKGLQKLMAHIQVTSQNELKQYGITKFVSNTTL
jgi:hypothetical protein